MQSKKQQESHPAWTQEVYRPRRNKYSICCPVLGGGGGYPTGGVPHPCRGYPTSGTPCQTWPGGTPSPAGPGWVPPPPSWTWPGYPSPPSWTWPGYPPGWTWPGYLPPRGVDRHLWKQHLTVVLRTRSVKIHLFYLHMIQQSARSCYQNIYALSPIFSLLPVGLYLPLSSHRCGSDILELLLKHRMFALTVLWSEKL